MDNSTREEANKLLDMIRDLIMKKSGGHDDGSCHEILRDYAAQSTKDVYTIIQNHEDYERGEPVRYSLTRGKWADFGNLMEKLHRLDTERVGTYLLTLPEDSPGLGLARDTTRHTLNGKRFKIEVHPHNSNYFKSTVEKEGAFYLSADKMRREPFFRTEFLIQPDKALDFPASGDWDKKFEQLITRSKVFTSPVYASEKDVDTPKHRRAY